MDQNEQNRINRVVQALTNQRNNALNECANMAAALVERDEAIAGLQHALAVATATKEPALPAPPAGVGVKTILESILEK